MPLQSAVPVPPTPVWQNPYVEVIRYGLAHRSVGWQQHGDVEQTTDPQIHKNVFRVRGAIAATNYVRFPREVSKTNQGLGLTGRFAYIQLRRARGHHATLHLDLLTAKKTALRFSFSTMYSSLRSTGTVLRVPFELSETWTTIAIDMVELLQYHGFNGYSRETYRYLKAVTCCASMNLRNVFTSPTCFTPQDLPANLSLPAAHENQCGPYVWLALPAVLGRCKPLRSPMRLDAKDPDVEDGRSLLHFSTHGKASNGSSEGEDEAEHDDAEFAAVSPLPSSSTPSKTRADESQRTAAATTMDASGTGGPPLSPSSRVAGLIRDREDVLSRADQIMRDAGFSVPSPRRQAQQQSKPTTASMMAAAPSMLSSRRFLASEQSDWPDPILSLTRIVGFSTAFAKALRWLPDAQACVYTSSSTIVIREFTAHGGGRLRNDLPPLLGQHHHQEVATASSWATRGGVTDTTALTDDREVFLTGHTGDICAMDVSHDGALLASAQNSPQCVLRLWDLRHGVNDCLAVVKAPTKSVHVLAFSKDATSLCCVGADAHARTQIVVWDCSSFLTPPAQAVTAPAASTNVSTKKLVLRARQTCDFPIHAIAFSPYEQDQLVSCGKENVRFWRIHAARHHLPGSPVILNEYSRGTVFTDLAFDSVYPQFPSNLPRIRPLYVSSSAGSIVVINYDSRDVVCVYKLHDAAIHSLCVNEGFCVTGSDDKFLRVWPLDFSDFFLEAEHEAPVQTVDVSSDGMRVAVGTTSGAVGVLHLADQRYRTVLRSHTKPVHAVAALPGGSLVSSASDGTLRVWDTATCTQTMEFDVSRDMVTCLAAMPSTGSGSSPTTIAAGFRSGCTRIFSLGGSTDQDASETTPRVMHEFQQHQSALCDAQYQSDGKTLYTSAVGQQLCMYDVEQGYSPVKMLIADVDPAHGRLCLSRDGRFLAVLQQGRRSVLLLDAASLCVVRVLTPPPPPPQTASAVEDSMELSHVVISWNSQELLTLSGADRLYVFSLREQSAGSAAASGVGFCGLLHAMPLLGQRGIASFALSPNLKYMATGGSDGSVRVWQCEFGRHKFQRMHQTFLLHAGDGAVRGLVFSLDGDQVISTSEATSAVFVWRFRGNTSKLPTLELPSDFHRGRKEAADAAKAGFRLPLDGLGSDAQADSTMSSGKPTNCETPAKPVEVLQLTVSDTRHLCVKWSHIIRPQNCLSPRCCVWACALGYLVSVIGCEGVVTVEKLDTGEQHFIRIAADSVDRIELSPCEKLLAIVPAALDAVLVHDMSHVRHGSNQSDGADLDARNTETVRVTFPHRLQKLHAVVFSTDASLLCVSGDGTQGERSMFVLDIPSGGDLVWNAAVAGSEGGATSIVAQSPREFLCVQPTSARPLQRLRVPPFALSSADLPLEAALDNALPSKPAVFGFRDDGLQPTDTDRRCRFGVAVDGDAYGFFFDLDRQRLIATVQLLLPVARSTIVHVEWIGTQDWQALVATLDDHSIAVFALPTRFSFSSPQTRVASVDWAQLKRVGRLSCALSLVFETHRIARVLVDPLGDAGVVLTQDGAAHAVNYQSGRRRSLRQAPSLQLDHRKAARPQLALNGSLVLTLSGDRHSLQCWDASLGHELARLHVPQLACSCFSVSPFDRRVVAAAYDDGSLRVFHVGDQRLVLQCVLPPTLSLRARPASGDQSPAEALSTLKQKQAARRHAAAMGSPSRLGDRKAFQELRWVGPLCVLTVTEATYSNTGRSAPRVILFDLSDVGLESPAASEERVAVVAADTSKRNNSSKPSKEKERATHYREVFLPDADRWIKQAPIRRSSPGARASDDGDVAVESVDVQAPSTASPATSKSGRRSRSEAIGTLTRAFLVVVRVCHRQRRTSVVVAHVFNGSDAAASHPVHAEDDAVPCDSWAIDLSDATPSSAIFHPSNASQVVYAAASSADGALWIEVRDFRARAVLVRCSLPSDVVSMDRPTLRPWRVHGKWVIMVSTAEGKRHFAVDLTKRVVLPVRCSVSDGSFDLVNCSGGDQPSQILVIPSSCQGSAAQPSSQRPGLVVAELEYGHAQP